MQSGRLHSKRLSTVDGTNLTNSATHSYKNVEIASIPSATANNLDYVGEDDSQKVISGVGGDNGAASPQTSPIRWGYTAPSGSRVEINDTDGVERLDIVHKSGAGFTVDPDGSIYLVSVSARGAGLQAPFGDIMITSGGDVVIKGASSVTVETSGDMNMDVGASLNVSCETFNLKTKNYKAVVDGPSSTNISNDQSTVIGGIHRTTVGGDMREQVSQSRIIDVGTDYTTRIGNDMSVNVGANYATKVKTDTTLDVGSNYSVTVESDIVTNAGNNIDQISGGNMASSVGGAYGVAVTGSIQMSSASSVGVYAGSSAFLTAAGGDVNVKGSGAVKLDGAAVNASPAVDRALFADEASQSGMASSLGGSIGPKPPAQSAGSASKGVVVGPEGPEGPDDAKVQESNDIMDSLSSARKHPDYPGNGVFESANSTGLGMIDHDRMPGAEGVYNDYSGGNTGNANPSQEMAVWDTLPEEPVNRDPNISATLNGMPVPSYGNWSGKVSKYFTVGMLLNGTATKNQPPSPANWDRIVKEGMLMAQNILDPVKEKFPDIVITSWYRAGTTNHGTGRAIDFVVESRSMTKHAEIARFARDNLPARQVFLEKNDSGRTHVHIMVSQNGQKGGGMTVLTCGDKRCKSKEPGIQLAWLARRAK